MKLLARGKRGCPNGHSAFTLIELLVVVVIVGIVSSFLLLSFGLLGNDRALDQQVRRLGSLLELSLDEATLQGRDFGLELMRSGYRFVELDPVLNRWGEVTGDDLLRPRQLDDGMEFELIIEDRRVTLADEAMNIKPKDEGDEERNDTSDRKLVENYAPHVLILSSGDISPFSVTVVRDSDRARKSLVVSLAGEIKVDADDEDAI
jgi:general secretion pathway protein H